MKQHIHNCIFVHAVYAITGFDNIALFNIPLQKIVSKLLI